jgi:hypothetical protein
MRQKAVPIPCSEIVHSREELEELRTEAKELGVSPEVLVKQIAHRYWRAKGLKLLPYDTLDQSFG